MKDTLEGSAYSLPLQQRQSKALCSVRLHWLLESKWIFTYLKCIYWVHTLFYVLLRAFLVVQTVKNQPVIQETWMGWKDPLVKGMATHSSILAWRILWTEESGRLQFMGSQGVRHDWATNTLDTGATVVKDSAYQCRSPETWVPSLGQGDPLEKEMASHCSIPLQESQAFLPGKSHGRGSLVGYSPWDFRVSHDLATKSQPPCCIAQAYTVNWDTQVPIVRSVLSVS